MAVGALAVRVSADTRPYQQGMRQTRRPAEDMRRQMNQVAVRAAAMTAAIAAAGAAIVANLVRRGMQAVDEQAKLARQLGATSEGLEGLTRAAKDSGISQEQMSTSVQMLNQRLGEAMRGSGQAAASLERLGLEARDLAQMDVDERMAAIADAMHESGMSAQQMADELRQLGIRSREMVRLMMDGGDSIRSATREMREYGTAVNEVDAAQIEAANDSWSRISDVIRAVSNRLAVEFAPIIQAVAELVTDAAKDSQGWGDTIRWLIDMGVSGFGFLADAVEGVRRTVVVAGQAIATLALRIKQSMFESADAVLSGPVDAINALIRTANRIPGVDFGVVEQPDLVTGVREQIRMAELAVAEGRRAMSATLAEPMPSEGIKQWVDDVREASREAAEEAVRSREDLTAFLSDEDPEDEAAAEKAEEERQRMRERMEARLEEMRRGLLSEAELERLNHEERMEFLEEALEKELLTQQQFDERSEMEEQAHWERMEEIRRRGLSDLERLQEASMRDQVMAFASAGNEMIAAAGRINDGLFKAAQIGGAAQAFVATLVGQAEALKLGWPAGPIAAAKIGAQGFGLVAAIRNASRSGSGGGSVGAGGVPATPTTDAGTPGQQPQELVQDVSVTLVGGNLFGEDQLRQLGDTLADNGGRIGSFRVQRG